MLSCANCPCGGTVTLMCAHKSGHAGFAGALARYAKAAGLREKDVILRILAEARRRASR